VPQESPQEGEGGQRAYQQLGRLMGLSLLVDCRLPVIFYRHVYKFLLGRPVGLTDLVYVDQDLATQYARFLEIVRLHRAGEGGEDPAAWGFSFEAEDTVDGQAEPVTAHNFESFIRWECAKRLTQPIQSELKALRRGMLEVVPEATLQGLCAEDLQLLLSGKSGQVSIEDLRSFLAFTDIRTASCKESDPQTLEGFEEVVWATLELMTDHQRVQFIAFVTGSPVLDQKMEVKLCDAPAHSGDGPFARQCAQYISIPSYTNLTPELLVEVLSNAMSASFEFDTI